MRSQPNAMPPCGGAPYLKASRRKPNFSCGLLLARCPSPRRPASGRRRGGYGSSRRRSRCRCRRCRRRRPARCRDPGRRSSRIRFGRGEGVVHRGPGAGADRDVARGRRVGGRLEQRRVDDPAGTPRRPRRSGRSGGRSRGGRHRAAARLRLDRRRRRRRRSRRAAAPTCAARPARSASERFLATGPPSSPSSLDEHVGQAAGAALLGPLLPGVELLARLARAAGHHDRADVRRPGRRGTSVSAKYSVQLDELDGRSAGRACRSRSGAIASA